MILDDSTKLVGVRLPITALPTLRHHLAEAVQARKAVVDSGGGGKVEPVSPIDPKILLQVKTPPKNILSFFGRISGASPSPSAQEQPRGVAATPPPVVEKRRQAGGAFASGGGGLGLAVVVAVAAVVVVVVVRPWAGRRGRLMGARAARVARRTVAGAGPAAPRKAWLRFLGAVLLVVLLLPIGRILSQR